MAASVAAAALLPICRVALRALPLKRFAPPRWALTDLRRRIPGCGMIRHTGQRVVIREHAPKARDFTNRRYRHRGVVDEVERAKNRTQRRRAAGTLVLYRRRPSGVHGQQILAVTAYDVVSLC